MVSQQRLLQAVLRSDLASFIAKCFYTVNPGVEFLPNWHIDVMADRLMAAKQGNTRRLIINIPPRYLKSLSVSVAFPCWLLGNAPHSRIVVASYSQILSNKHSLDARLVMQSSWYKALFPETRLVTDQNEKHKFMTAKRGFRFATSVGGTVTGEGGDVLIADDPHNPLQVMSDVQRNSSIEWFEQSFMSRLDNKKQGAIIVVMQRLHVNDLSGHLLEKGGWDLLSLPAEAERQVTYYYGRGKKKIRKKDSFLHAAREGKHEIARMRCELGKFGYSAQYLQSPILREGGMVAMAWFRRYRGVPAGYVVQSWDTAMSDGSNSDYSVCVTLCMAENAYYVLDVWRGQLLYPDLKRMFMRLYGAYAPKAVLVEDAGSGRVVLQELRRERRLPVIRVVPREEKILRFSAVTALFESGCVFLPEQAEWLMDFERELCNFPYAGHDDQVDAVSQALNWLKCKATAGERVRVRGV